MEVAPAGNRYTLRRYLERGSKELKTRPFRMGHWLVAVFLRLVLQMLHKFQNGVNCCFSKEMLRLG